MNLSVDLQKLLKTLLLLILFVILSLFASCGPVVYTAAPPGPPPPSWFYPNRVEVVRYVYFPELRIYFDMYTHTYLYLDSGVWVRRDRLPARLGGRDLSRYKYRRIPGYRSDDITPYDRQQRQNSGRSNREYNRSSMK
jgi:hypothetical protein